MLFAPFCDAIHHQAKNKRQVHKCRWTKCIGFHLFGCRHVRFRHLTRDYAEPRSGFGLDEPLAPCQAAPPRFL